MKVVGREAGEEKRAGDGRGKRKEGDSIQEMDVQWMMRMRRKRVTVPHSYCNSVESRTEAARQSVGECRDSWRHNSKGHNQFLQ